MNIRQLISALLILLFGSAIFGIVLLLNYTESKLSAREIAGVQGEAIFHLTQSFREWNAGHGGVYVPGTNQTPSNPFLLVDDKDVTDSIGRWLTKLNPAYMTRQLHEQQKGGRVEVRLTSLRTVNPANQPDDWERRSLTAFERGTKGGLTSEEDGYYRYIAPLYAEKPCMQCHYMHGYRLGDVRGALSIRFKAEQIDALLDRVETRSYANHWWAYFAILGFALALFFAINWFLAADAKSNDDKLDS